LGKELAVFVHRLRRQAEQLRAQNYLVKFSGAVGNFNAHGAAYPDIDWRAASARFLRGFGLEPNPITTQIEPHDYMAEIFGLIVRVNSILIDLDRDIWSYVSLGYLRQRLYEGEVGSSTMPHKINPIDFENSEANAGLSTAILAHLATKLPISRMQRDLSDSAAIRAVGTGIGHGLLALKACLAGLDKIDVDEQALRADLERNWAVLGEAIQTVMRKHGVEDAYEQIKAATQTQQLDAAAIRRLLERTSIPEPDRSRLISLTPAGFIGAAAEIGRAVLDRE
jgi:adenylosuccinate lyase